MLKGNARFSKHRQRHHNSPSKLFVEVKLKVVAGLALDPMSWPWCSWGSGWSAVEAIGLNPPLKLEANVEAALCSAENTPEP